VPLRVDAQDPALLWLTTPRIQNERTFESARCAEVLGLSSTDLLEVAPQRLSAGNPTLFIALRTREAVDRAWLDLSGAKALRGSEQEPFCVFVFTPTESGAYSRMFAPEFGVPEDPATGSATGPLAAFMMQAGLVSQTAGTRFVSEQGSRMGRRSLLHVLIRGKSGSEGIDVGGHVTPIASGIMEFHG